jgi:hypothetical protein
MAVSECQQEGDHRHQQDKKQCNPVFSGHYELREKGWYFTAWS